MAKQKKPKFTYDDLTDFELVKLFIFRHNENADERALHSWEELKRRRIDERYGCPAWLIWQMEEIHKGSKTFALSQISQDLHDCSLPTLYAWLTGYKLPKKVVDIIKEEIYFRKLLWSPIRKNYPKNNKEANFVMKKGFEIVEEGIVRHPRGHLLSVERAMDSTWEEQVWMAEQRWLEENGKKNTGARNTNVDWKESDDVNVGLVTIGYECDAGHVHDYYPFTVAEKMKDIIILHPLKS